MSYYVQAMLTDRDTFRPDSLEWQWRNITAWRVYLHEQGGLLSDTTPPPADFGLAYLEPQHGIAAE